jgi:tetratricopeptide (TPR) repeat protein
VQRQALAILSAIRPALARLDRSRGAIELSADLRESWAGVETAVRALMGGSPLSGTQLIREARQRQMLTFDQANALAAFHAANERSNDAAYQPTESDIQAARTGFEMIEGSLSMANSDERDLPPRGEAMSTKGLRLSPLGTPRPVPLPPERQPWWFVVAGVVVIAGLAVGAWWLFMRGPSATPLDRGIAEMQAGRRDLAVAEFERVVRENPKNALAHVYLARMARERGDGVGAREHATLAVQAEPTNGAALREMGAILLAAGDFETSRRFYVRALEANADDRAAQGYLGCALIKLGRTDEGTRWMERAGTGAWDACKASPSSP